MEIHDLPGAALAYMGDAAFEVLVRRRLLLSGQTNSGKMNRMALRFVKATAQAEASERILPFLCEEEADILRRGRNAHGISAPKSADTVTYRKATGLEALFGWLYLTGQSARADELFDLAFPVCPETPAQAGEKENPT